MTSLPQRVISAVFALILVGVVNHFFASQGIGILGLVLCSIGVFEYQNIAFTRYGVRLSLRLLFILASVTLLVMSAFAVPYLREVWGVLLAGYFAAALWLVRGRFDNEKLLNILALSGLGFLYCSLFPAFALGLLNLKSGNWWFVYLLSTVFVGDIFAFFSGFTFGGKKLMPTLSPNKTFAGSVGGIAGSIGAGMGFHFIGLTHVSILTLGAVGFVVALLAQNGDLFESLLKRVALVKDSGRIMPGHGGVLDRLDGVYFAAPVVFAAAQVLS